MRLRKTNKKKYSTPKLEKRKIADLSKGWDLAALDIVGSCKGTCVS
jgi:hypothetical protein